MKSLSYEEYTEELESATKKNRYGNWHIGTKTPNSLIQVDQTAVSSGVLGIRRTLQENQATKSYFNRDSGPVIDVKNLATVAAGNRKVFGKKVRPSVHSYHWVVMLDVSGSLAGERIIRVRNLGATLGEIFSRLGHQFEMYAHTTLPGGEKGQFAADGFRRSAQLVVAVVKTPEERWGERQLERLSKIRASAGNLDGHATLWARKRLDVAPKNPTDRILLYVTDGEMPAANGLEEKRVLESELDYFRRRRGYAMAGLGINTDSPKQHGLPTLEINENADLAQLGKFVHSLVR